MTDQARKIETCKENGNDKNKSRKVRQKRREIDREMKIAIWNVRGTYSEGELDLRNVKTQIRRGRGSRNNANRWWK